MPTTKCPNCGYVWEPRTEDPKACPRCKRRLDYPPKGREKE